MKKLLIPVVLFMLIATATDAQNIYFRGGLGYAAPHGGAVQGPIFSYSQNSFFPVNGSYNGTYLPTNTTESFELKKTSFTAGVQGILAAGLMLNKNIGVELAANVGLSTQQMKTQLNSEEVDEKVKLDVTQQSDMPLMLTPSLVLQTSGKIQVYARGGIVLPVQAIILQDLSFQQDRLNIADSTYVRRTVNLTEQFNMRFSPGFSGALGAKYKIGKRMSVWAEASILSMTLYYKESVLTSASENGTSVLSYISPQDRTTKYEFEGNITGNSNIVPTVQAPFSNAGINVGVSVGF